MDIQLEIRSKQGKMDIQLEIRSKQGKIDIEVEDEATGDQARAGADYWRRISFLTKRDGSDHGKRKDEVLLAFSFLSSFACKVS